MPTPPPPHSPVSWYFFLLFLFLFLSNLSSRYKKIWVLCRAKVLCKSWWLLLSPQTLYVCFFGKQCRHLRAMLTRCEENMQLLFSIFTKVFFKKKSNGRAIFSTPFHSLWRRRTVTHYLSLYRLALPFFIQLRTTFLYTKHSLLIFSPTLTPPDCFRYDRHTSALMKEII